MKTRLRLFLFINIFAISGYAQDYKPIRTELESVYLQSLKIRSNVGKIYQQYGPNSPQLDSMNQVIMEYDSVSLLRVIHIIDNYGWLGKQLVGEEANMALFLTIQHAQDAGIRQKYFPLLKESADEGGSDKANMATMFDRIQVDLGKKQLYGTQSRFVDGKSELYPVEKPEHLNKRRRKVGLPKLKL